MPKLTGDQLQLAIRYSEDLLRIDLWCGKAEELLRSARSLEPAISSFWQAVTERRPIEGRFGDVHAPYFMLVGFALENLCKAALLHRKRGALEGRIISRLPKFLTTHDLRSLFKQLGLAITVVHIRQRTHCS